LLANGVSRDFGAKTESALSLTLSLKGEGTVRCALVFPCQPICAGVNQFFQQAQTSPLSLQGEGGGRGLRTFT